MGSRWERELMVSSPASPPKELLQDNTPSERSRQPNIILCRRRWLGAEGEAVVQNLVFGCDQCIAQMFDCISVHVVQIIRFPIPASKYDFIALPCNSRLLISSILHKNILQI